MRDPGTEMTGLFWGRPDAQAVGLGWYESGLWPWEGTVILSLFRKPGANMPLLRSLDGAGGRVAAIYMALLVAELGTAAVHYAGLWSRCGRDDVWKL